MRNFFEAIVYRAVYFLVLLLWMESIHCCPFMKNRKDSVPQDSYHRHLQSSTSEPSTKPIVSPSSSASPSSAPTLKPSFRPSSRNPSVSPTIRPSTIPSVTPSKAPSFVPSLTQSVKPSVTPTTKSPSTIPSFTQSVKPSVTPTTKYPSTLPSFTLSINPSVMPSIAPSLNPSVTPTTKSPSTLPSFAPSTIPSVTPSITPLWNPSANPTTIPSFAPSTIPSVTPSITPLWNPSATPTTFPSFAPSTTNPSVTPWASPSFPLTATPSITPSITPSASPSVPASGIPSSVPSINYAFSYPLCAKSSGALVQYANRTRLCTVYRKIKADLDTTVTSFQGDLFKTSDLYGKAVRLVFHDVIDLDLSKPGDLMGADGCIGDAAESAGLIEPSSPVLTQMEPIYQKYCDVINRADFFVLFAKLVIEKSEPTGTIKLPFQVGRRETRNCNAGAGRAPDAQDGVPALRQAFVNQLGLNYSDAVALLGAHTLGHVHAASSGYDGHPGDTTKPSDVTVNAWDLTPSVFDNKYYLEVIKVPWAVIYNKLTDKTKSIWIHMNCGADGNQYPTPANVNQCTGGPYQEGKLIALNTDMALVFPLNVSVYQNKPYATGLYLEHCVTEDNGPFDKHHCYGPVPNGMLGGHNFIHVDFNQWPDPTTDMETTYKYLLPLAIQYSNSNAAFLAAFKTSWQKMVSAGYGTVGGAAGKLGSLTSVTC